MDYSKKANARRKLRQLALITRTRNKIGVLVARAAAAVILIAGFAVVGAVLGIYLGIIQNSPALEIASVNPEKHTSIIYSAQTGEEIYRLVGTENRVNVDFENIPQNLINAFLAIEDERFYTHNGVDIRGMGRAVYSLLRSEGTSVQGASTITQQLIKNKLGKFDSDLISKLQEQYLAIEFEKTLASPDMFGSKQAAKDYILGVYLNTINLGRGYFGVQTAAWNYYGKDVSELTLAESATIAAITKNPSKLAPDLRPVENRERMEYVLGNMLRLEMITEEEFEEAWEEDVYNNIIQGVRFTDGSYSNSYFTDMLINQIHQDLMETYQLTSNEAYEVLYNGGLQIFSTQDMEIQASIDNVMQDPEYFPAGDFEIDVEYRLTTRNIITGRITNYNKRATVKTMEEAERFIASVQNEILTANDVIVAEMPIYTEQPQSGFIVIDYHNGHVKGMSGGRGEKPVNRAFNRAIDAMRSPGSQFKTLASYAAGLDMGTMTPATVFDDAPYDVISDGYWEHYVPNNWYGANTFEGLTHIRRGLYRSMNVLAVRAMMTTGIETTFEYLLRFGFTTLVEGEWHTNGRWMMDKVASLTLGGLTNGVTLLELAAAYGTIANMGEYNQPVFYTGVLDHGGNVLLENDSPPRRVIQRTTAHMLTDILRDTMGAPGSTGGRASFDEVRMPIAGKTGTSTETKDLGFTGYTPYYVASVWLGFDQQKTIVDTNAHHLRIWKSIMEEIHRNLAYREFQQADGIINVSVCRDSGMLPSEACASDPRGNRAYTEIFASGTQPTNQCRVHHIATICTVSGMLHSSSCPSSGVATVAGIIRPIPIDYELNPSASVQDAAYELDPSILSNVLCTLHLFSFPSGFGTTGQTNPGNWYEQFFVDGLIPANPTPTPGENNPWGTTPQNPSGEQQDTPVVPPPPPETPVYDDEPDDIPDDNQSITDWDGLMIGR